MSTIRRTVSLTVAFVLLVAGLCLVGARRERAALPAAAHSLLAATTAASQVTSCLNGASDEVYVPAADRLHDPIAIHASLSRLNSCDLTELARTVDAVHLVPAAPLTTASRRQARAEIVEGVDALRRMLLDAQSARTALATTVRSGADGTAAVLAYRSAEAASDRAYKLVLEALAHLDEAAT